ncbi:TM2 domain-containing membrane protein YozV [Prosthecobacter debontii]|uniref:TM2 domain-containing membrane protein YozV n=2 Tax=Prosthecobacter debontii TaxID=48467 RepID=A0A1T4WSC8_9BACT|nr:TM2 domain-containing membrane protein YozV [Prosthecobacter debontii]
MRERVPNPSQNCSGRPTDKGNANTAMNAAPTSTHNKAIGYILWIFGFTGSHRFYFGKPITGIIWLFTGGLFLIGWIVDLFLIPSMDRDADARYATGPYEYSVAWLLLTFLGIFGVHRFYQRKWLSAILYLLTGGGFLIGVIYDFCTLNGQIDELNRKPAQ